MTNPGAGAVRHPIFSQTGFLEFGGTNGGEIYNLNLKYAVVKPGIDFGHGGTTSANAGPYSSNNMLLG